MILALVLTWLAPLADCGGGSLDLHHYHVLAAKRSMEYIVGCPLDDAGNLQKCMVVSSLVSDTTATSLALPEPALNEAVMWNDPVAVDAAGNTSDQCQ